MVIDEVCLDLDEVSLRERELFDRWGGRSHPQFQEMVSEANPCFATMGHKYGFQLTYIGFYPVDGHFEPTFEFNDNNGAYTLQELREYLGLD